MPLLRLDADAKKGVKAFDDLEKSIDKVGDKLELTAREAKKLETAAGRIAKQNEAPQERYNRKVGELATLVNSGKLSMDEAQKAAARYGATLDRATQKGREAFAPSLLANYATGFAAPMGAANIFLGMLRDIRNEQKEIADKQISILPGRAKLAQLSGGDPKKLQNLKNAADQAYASGFVQSREQSYGLAYELGSAGLTSDYKFFSQLSLVEDSAAAAKAVGLVNSGFKGGDEVGSSQAVISKAIAASLPATGVSLGDVAQGVAMSSAGAKKMGFSDEEAFAAISMLSQVTGSGQQAGTQFKALTSSFTHRGLADEMYGKGLEAVIKNIDSKGYNQKQLDEYFGSGEAANAFTVLRNIPAFRDRIGEINKAQSENLAGQVIASAVEDKVVGAGVLRRRKEAYRELAQEQGGVETNLADAERDAAYVYDLQHYGNGVRTWGNDKIRGTLDWVNPGAGTALGRDGELGSALQSLVDETRETNNLLRTQGAPTTRQE